MSSGNVVRRPLAVRRLTVVLRANLAAETLPISRTRARMLGLIFAFHHLIVLRSPGMFSGLLVGMKRPLGEGFIFRR
jgi:hypothetical protein